MHTIVAALRGLMDRSAFVPLTLLVACGPRPGPIDVVEATIADVQDAIIAGRTTCRMVVQAYLDRIEAYDSSTGLDAITVVNPNALSRAGEIDAAVSNGDELGPLFCAPLLIKDNFDTQDLPTTGGSIALRDDLPPDDAFMVRKLREADGIVLAKTNMAEWAFSARQTVSSSYGTTANAYALDRVPAGSSGGTASGVAASFGVAGMGADTGNSIRGPSSHLALFGIRSTIGLTSRDGVIPLAFDRDIAGPMTRTVEDAARIFTVVAGYDPADPYTEAGRGKNASDYTLFLDSAGLQGARIGVLRALVDTEEADTAVIALFEQALRDLRRLGASIVDPLEIPAFQRHRDARTGMQTVPVRHAPVPGHSAHLRGYGRPGSSRNRRILLIHRGTSPAIRTGSGRRGAGALGSTVPTVRRPPRPPGVPDGRGCRDERGGR